MRVFLFVQLRRRPRKPHSSHQDRQNSAQLHVPAIIEQDGQHLVLVPGEPSQADAEHEGLLGPLRDLQAPDNAGGEDQERHEDGRGVVQLLVEPGLLCVEAHRREVHSEDVKRRHVVADLKVVLGPGLPVLVHEPRVVRERDDRPDAADRAEQDRGRLLDTPYLVDAELGVRVDRSLCAWQSNYKEEEEEEKDGVGREIHFYQKAMRFLLICESPKGKKEKSLLF